MVGRKKGPAGCGGEDPSLARGEKDVENGPAGEKKTEKGTWLRGGEERSGMGQGKLEKMGSAGQRKKEKKGSAGQKKAKEGWLGWPEREERKTEHLHMFPLERTPRKCAPPLNFGWSVPRPLP